MLNEVDEQMLADVQSEFAKKGIDVDITIHNEKNKNDFKETCNFNRVKISGGRRLKEILASDGDSRFTDPDDIKVGFWFYAIASRTGYGLYNSINAVKNQMQYFRDVVVKEFYYADDAYEWIKATVPELAHIRGHNFISLDELLKKKNYWFYSEK